MAKARNENVSQAGKDEKEEIRGTRGTPDYFNPELFHEDWEAANWHESDIAANYNPLTCKSKSAIPTYHSYLLTLKTGELFTLLRFQRSTVLILGR